jgi:DMSO/TMAO reductase YedYZ molybdopterin-dependent catalytic subunit
VTRYRFLRFLLFGIFSLMVYPLRALAGGEPPQASVTLDSNSKRRPGNLGYLKRSARFPSLSREPGLVRVSGMQSKAPVPTGAVQPITPNSEFYVEDIHGPPKPLNTETWRLKVTGKIDRPLTLSLDQIRKRPAVRQIITLSCIGNPVGGYALGNAEWEGVSLKDLLDEADPDFFTKTLIFKGADGYHDSIPLSRGRHRAVMLAHTMNGEPLPREHGSP